jgi:WD40 repeat protein
MKHLKFVIALAVSFGAIASVAYRPLLGNPTDDATRPAAGSSQRRPPHLDAYGDPLPAGARLRVGTNRFRHGSIIDVMALSPDGKLLATAGMRAIRVWDVPSGRLRRSRNDVPVSQGVGGCLSVMTFAPDNRTLIYGTEHSEPGVLEVDTGKERSIPIPDKGWGTYTVACSPDGRFFGVCTQKNELLVLDFKTHATLWSSKPTSMLIAFSPDSRTVVLGGKGEEEVILADAASGRPLRRYTHGDEVTKACFSPDGRTLAIGGADGIVGLWSVTNGAKLGQIVHPNARLGGCHVTALALSPDGKSLAAGASEKSGQGLSHAAIFTWRVADGKMLHALRYEGKAVTGVVFVDGGRLLLSTDWPGNIRVWETATGAEKTVVEGEIFHDHVAISPDGRLLASGGRDGAIRISDARSGRRVRDLTGHPGGVSSLAFDSTGETLASAGRDMVVRVWSVASGRERVGMRCGPEGARPINCLAFSPDGRSLAVPDGGRTFVHLCDPGTGTETGRFSVEAVERVAFTQDGRTLVAAAADGSATFWDTRKARVRRVVPGTADEAMVFLAAAPDGRLLAFGTHESGIRLWDVETDRELARIPGDLAPNVGAPSIISAIFSPDGRWLLSGGWNREIRLWEIATRREWHCFSGQGGTATDVAFSPDGREAVSAGKDGTVLVWDLWATSTAGSFESEKVYHSLAAADGAEAYRAMQMLVAHPEPAVQLLGEKMQPAAPPLKAERFRELVARLDGRKYAERQQAAREIAAMGPTIEGLLQESLRTVRSEEVRNQLSRLLESVRAEGTKTRIRHTRALGALELIGTVNAKALLRKLAGGWPAADLTRQARESMERLERRR